METNRIHCSRRQRRRWRPAETMMKLALMVAALAAMASAQDAADNDATPVPVPAPTTPAPIPIDATTTTPEDEGLFSGINATSSAPIDSPTMPPLTPPSTSPSTRTPTLSPLMAPSSPPSTSPPTTSPSYPPSSSPSSSPSSHPSASPSDAPTPMVSHLPSWSTLPTIRPTVSYAPSLNPSSLPSQSPSMTKRPSVSPSASRAPSGSPTNRPSYSPIIAPSVAPSLTEEVAYSRTYIQRLLVSVPQSLDLAQVDKFQYLYEQYTGDLGYMVGDPQISTLCTVVSQQIGINSVRGSAKRGGIKRSIFHARMLLGSILDRWFGTRMEERLLDQYYIGSRKLQPTDEEEEEQTGYPLTMRFMMRYSTRVGVLDISTYNTLFADYVNANLEKVAADLGLLGLPVVSAGDVLLLKDKSIPTAKPSLPPVPLPTMSPATVAPTDIPTSLPSTERPTDVPSDGPSAEPPILDVDVSNDSFALGLGLGLAGAFLVSALAYFWNRNAEKKKAEEKKQRAVAVAQAHAVAMGDDGGYPGEGLGRSHPGYAKDGSVDNMDSGAASKTTIDLTPNEDVEDQRAMEQHRNDHHDHQPQYAQHASSHNDDAGVIIRDDLPYGKEHPEHSPAGHLGAYPNGMLAPLSYSDPPGPNRRASHAGLAGEQDPYQSEPGMPPLTQTASQDASVNNYNNLFHLPYDRSGETMTPPGTFASVAQFPGGGGGGTGGSPNNTLLIHNASFSSGSDSEDMEGYDDDDHDELYNNPGLLDGSQDELDNYKNQDLELLRSAVEEAVDEVEGMMSLAVTRALTVDMDASMELPWAGAGDHGSVEASCLCEAYDWLKRHEDASADSVNEYFQDILNRIVLAVVFGMTSPLHAAQLVHACATILGLDLLNDLPEKTLIVTGMRKTNDLAQGHNFIVKAFKPFGKIEEAAIAPNNRGFGFVRFVKPESVKRALKKYREFEIEIQDVSVSIKTLKSERPR